MKTSSAVIALVTLAVAAVASPGDKLKPCGGLQGIECPKGYECKDKKSDGCNPYRGGADCPGQCVKKHHTVTTCQHGTICVDKVNKCGIKYGGCYDTCTPTTFTPPPCPKTTTKSTCKHQTICKDYINSCGETYGGCYDICTPTTFAAPPCTKTTADKPLIT